MTVCRSTSAMPFGPGSTSAGVTEIIAGCSGFEFGNACGANCLARRAVAADTEINPPATANSASEAIIPSTPTAVPIPPTADTVAGRPT